MTNAIYRPLLTPLLKRAQNQSAPRPRQWTHLREQCKYRRFRLAGPLQASARVSAHATLMTDAGQAGGVL
eukprot:5778669-Pleurochrysis_carterae.AAC.6